MNRTDHMWRGMAGMRLSAVGVVVSVMALTGCISQEIEPEYIPRVATSQNYLGEVYICWPSKVGYNYRLVAIDKEGNPVTDKKVYVGTGELIEVRFKRDPSKPLPEYSVLPEKIP